MKEDERGKRSPIEILKIDPIIKAGLGTTNNDGVVTPSVTIYLQPRITTTCNKYPGSSFTKFSLL